MSDVTIDRTLLDATLRELGPGFARILGYFREDSAKSVIAIEDAVRARDAVALVRPAHTLKGEALQFGAAALARVAERIEQGARAAVEDHTFPAEAVEEVVKLRPLLHEAFAALEAFAHPAAAAVPARRPGGFGRKVTA